MENINLHIEYLLQKHDCVILPGIGAFIVCKRPAEVDCINGTINPPCRYISFNAAISHDDGILANSISRRRKIKFEDAREIISSFVSTMRKTLLSHGTVQIGKIGSLSLGSEDKLNFIPRLSSEQLMVEMGHEKLALNQPYSADKSISGLSAGDIVSLSHDPYINREKYYYLRINKTFAHAAASVLIVLTIALSLVIPTFNEFKKPVEASVFPVERFIFHNSDIQPILEVCPTLEKNNDETLGNVVVPEDEKEFSASSAGSDDIESGASSTISADFPRYHLIVATFHTEKDAMKYVAMSTSSSLSIINSGRTWRVSALASTDKERIREKLNIPSTLENYPGAWIWEERNKNY